MTGSLSVSMPHYLLFSETGRADDSGRWRFVLRGADDSQQIEASDVEPKVSGDRLDLLTVVRALESLDQPSRVTLVRCSPYVRQGMQYGLLEWRENGWRWEFFGQMVPVRNGDLWQRLDRALRFHQVECGHRHFDPPHESLSGPKGGGRESLRLSPSQSSDCAAAPAGQRQTEPVLLRFSGLPSGATEGSRFGIRLTGPRWLRYGVMLLSGTCRWVVTAVRRRGRRCLIRSWRALAASPWTG